MVSASLKKIKIEESIKNIFGIIFAISSIMLSFELMGGTTKAFITRVIITAFVTFSCSLYFYFKTKDNIFKYIKENKSFSFICIIIAYIVCFQLYIVKLTSNETPWMELEINIFKFYIISIFSLMYLSIFVGSKIKEWIIDLYKSLDQWDKKAYIICSIIGFFIILITYNITHSYYNLDWDKVYSLDSGKCFNQILPKAEYYDIRHPILSIFAFPVFAVANFIARLLCDDSLITIVEAILVQFLNLQMLILIGIQLKLITKNKNVFIMYILSFPTMLYALFFEKYQLCTFLLVLYAISICKKRNSKSLLISAAGCMLTSCVMGIFEFFTDEKLHKKLFNIFKIIAVTILICICFGKSNIFNGLNQIHGLRTQYAREVSIGERAISTTKMIQGAFIALPSTVVGDRYLWKDLMEHISVIGLVICTVVSIGGIVNRKSMQCKVFITWSLFSLILFIILNWAINESPLFSIYFSWAFIPLFVMGMDYIIEKFKMNFKLVYVIIFILMLIVNVSTLYDIACFI